MSIGFSEIGYQPTGIDDIPLLLLDIAGQAACHHGDEYVVDRGVVRHSDSFDRGDIQTCHPTHALVPVQRPFARQVGPSAPEAESTGRARHRDQPGSAMS